MEPIFLLAEDKKQQLLPGETVNNIYFFRILMKLVCDIH